MPLDTLQQFLGWCTAISFALLAIMTVAMWTMRSAAQGIHSRMFGLGEDDLQRAYFQYLAQFKIAAIIFNLVPYLALRMMA